MNEDLTNSQIALLCAIGEADPSKLTGDHTRDLEELIAEGYVEAIDSHPESSFRLTAKGAEFYSRARYGIE